MGKGNCVNLVHCVWGVLCVVMLMQRSVEATSFVVGGSKGWNRPSDSSAVFNQWAERMRFQIGDSLLFVYPGGSDSVLEVTKDDYTNCNTNSPIQKHSDGQTQIKLTQSGAHYFISGNKDSCLKNEKLVVVVLSDRTTKPAASSPPSPPPSVAVAAAPAPTSTPPTTAAMPAPSDDSDDQPSPSGAHSLSALVGLVGISFIGLTMVV